MAGFNRPQQRQMGLLFGRQGAMITDLQNDLLRPRTLALITVVTALLLAGSCFYLARRLEHEDKLHKARPDAH